MCIPGLPVMYAVLIVLLFFTRGIGEELQRLFHKMKIAHEIFMVSGDLHIHAHTHTCTHTHTHSHSHTLTLTLTHTHTHTHTHTLTCSATEEQPVFWGALTGMIRQRKRLRLSSKGIYLDDINDERMDPEQLSQFFPPLCE